MRGINAHQRAMSGSVDTRRFRLPLSHVVKLLITCLWLLPFSVFSAEIEVPSDVDVVQLDGQWSFMDDPDHSLTLTEVIEARARGRFMGMASGLSRGYTASASWLTLDLKNSSASDVSIFLRFGPQFLDHVDVYWQVGKDASSPADYRLIRLGDHMAEPFLPAAAFPFMALPVDLTHGSVRRVYVRLETTSSHFMYASVASRWRFTRDGVVKIAWQCAYQSLALWVAMLTFLQGFRLRDLTHGLYGCLPLGLCLNSVGTEGTLFLVAPFWVDPLNDWLVGGSILLMFGGLSLFGARFFDARSRHPFWYRYLVSLTLLSVWAFMASGTVWYGRITTIVMGAGLLLWIFMVWASAHMIRNGERQIGQMMLMAFLLPLFVAATSMLRYLGLVPQSTQTLALVPVTSLIHMVFMSLALSERLSLIESKLRSAVHQISLETEHRGEKEKLIAMMTHEIRSPISVIQAAVQSLQIIEGAPSQEREIRYERISSSIRRLSLMMTIAENHTGRKNELIEKQACAFDLLLATKSVIELFDESDRSRIHLEALSGIPRIFGVEMLLCFCWMNLIDNACKYSPAGSDIKISLLNSRWQGVDGVIWQIEDQGPGIPKGREETIFEQYWRSGECMNIPGMGLGLHLARNVVKEHGGRLYAEAARPAGACFVCWLPLKPVNGEDE